MRFDGLRLSLLTSIFCNVCISFPRDEYSLLRITLKSVFLEQMNGVMFNGICNFFLFFWSYPGCTLRSVHGDDRIATGSGNISNERFREEVVTTFGMRFIFFMLASFTQSHAHHCPNQDLTTPPPAPPRNRFYKKSN